MAGRVGPYEQRPPPGRATGRCCGAHLNHGPEPEEVRGAHDRHHAVAASEKDRKAGKVGHDVALVDAALVNLHRPGEARSVW